MYVADLNCKSKIACTLLGASVIEGAEPCTGVWRCVRFKVQERAQHLYGKTAAPGSEIESRERVIKAGSMNMPMKIMGLIPARSGSKGVPRKNIRLLAGKPLITWTIEQALASRCLDRVIVSTDSCEIADIAKGYGAEIPFLRPAELASDETPDLPVYRHALSWIGEREGYCPDYVVWLRPTSPLRTASDISAAASLLVASDADCVRSVCRMDAHPYYSLRIVENRLCSFLPSADDRHYLRRQLLPEVYHVNGCVDVVRCTSIKDPELLFSGNMLPYIMPLERSLDIDTDFHFRIAEFLMNGRAPLISVSTAGVAAGEVPNCSARESR
jgi:CMP-N,N'-diacetyllegionaminic acid synthase